MSVLDTIRNQPKGRLAAAGGALTVVVVVGLALLLTGGEDDPPPETTTTRPEPPTTTVPPPVAPLTGLPVEDEAVLDRPAIVIKIDNVPDARPPVGLRNADLVFEERVEGDVTRLAAVFHSRDAEPIGPVRSTRTTDLEIASLFPRPLFASSGGNASVMGQVRSADLVDIGHNVDGVGFARDPARRGPHNLFTSTRELYQKGSGHDLGPPNPLFEYRDEDDGMPEGSIPVGGVALRFGGAEISRFTWDADEASWPRDQEGTPHVDDEGIQLAPANVVVLEIEYDFSGQLGRSTPHGVVNGEGRAVVLSDGQAIEGRWVRFGLTPDIALLTDDDEVIALTPGQTFIELVPAGGWSFI